MCANSARLGCQALGAFLQWRRAARLSFPPGSRGFCRSIFSRTLPRGSIGYGAARMRIPIHARAVFDALHFGGPRFDKLNSLTVAQWRELIAFCHRTQLAIPFALRCHDRLPSLRRAPIQPGSVEQCGALAAHEAGLSPGRPCLRSRGARIRRAQRVHARSLLRIRSTPSSAI